MKALQKDGCWIVVQGARFKDFVFDILAINPETKALKVVEIIVGHDGLNQKRTFCAKNGIELEVIQPKKTLFTPGLNEKAEIYQALADVQRLMILTSLKSGLNMWCDLITGSGLNASKDAGTFGYHLNILLQAGLVERREGRYALTQRGATFV